MDPEELRRQQLLRTMLGQNAAAPTGIPADNPHENPLTARLRKGQQGNASQLDPSQLGIIQRMIQGQGARLRFAQKQGMSRLGAGYMVPGGYKQGTPWEPGAIVGGGHTGVPAVPGGLTAGNLSPQRIAQRAFPTPQQAAPGLDAAGMPPTVDEARDEPGRMSTVPQGPSGYPDRIPTGLPASLRGPLKDYEKYTPPPPRVDPASIALPSGMDPESAAAIMFQRQAAAAQEATEKGAMSIRTLRGNIPGRIQVTLPGGKRRQAARARYNATFGDPEARSAMLERIQIRTGEYQATVRRQLKKQHAQAVIDGIASGTLPPEAMRNIGKIYGDIDALTNDQIANYARAQRGGQQPNEVTDLTRANEQPSPYATWGRNLAEEMEVVRNNRSLPPEATSMMDAIGNAGGNGRAPSHSVAVDAMFNSETMSGATVDQFIGLLTEPYIQKVLSQYPDGEKATKSMITNLLMYQTRSRPIGRDRPTGDESDIIRGITARRTGVEKGRREIEGLRRGRAYEAASQKVEENVYGSKFRRAMERANSL